MSESVTTLALALAATSVGASLLVSLGYWMGSRASSSTLVAMKSMDEVTTSTCSTLAQVTMQAASAMNDPRQLQTLQTILEESRTLSIDVKEKLSLMENSCRETREATLLLHGPERSRVEREILNHPSPKPVITVSAPESLIPRAGWGTMREREG